MTVDSPTAQHVPVMRDEAVAGLNIQPGQWYIDATFGRGGHTSAILAAKGKVIAFDWDQEAIAYGQRQFASDLAAHRLELVHASFDQLSTELTKRNIPSLAGVLFDFGTSSDQLTNSTRGFSFQDVGELDMRMDQRLGVKAKDLLAVLSEAQLAEVFLKYGGEREAYRLAKALVHQRRLGKYLTTTTDLANFVARTKKQARTHLHPATKIFQALRIAVNGELDAIEQALPQALAELKKTGQGRIVTIAFHEGEDRLVKTAFTAWEKAGLGQVLTKKPLTPNQTELDSNNKARSAKLRIFELNLT